MADDEDSKKAIDITSPKFDPFTALYSRNVHLPSPNAPILDNISKFQETKEGISFTTFYRNKVQQSDKSQASTSTSKPRFQPHQEPVPGKPRKPARTVLTRMKHVRGPLSLLQKFMDDRIRVKVYNRNMIGIRGYCLGYLVAFDKHFNMALEDVTEIWTRKKHQKTPALGPGDDVEVPTIKVVIRSSTPKTEECERHIPQLFMRGEHVVCVMAQDK
ncbi:U7 snRNA-associated Sm-like protein LSm11 [Macrosteles quadrilineatus]|uniref:U7 snRNA-associated Sm-like protein LSm11 n=1 Tax=Macrosteles quadrilineatus TaxID=74068 RepID=UPI0023E26243|nr:U7 snRNA-associated Sm-like protein LSm11 [Macrosteles quadrilineatus]